MFGPTSRYANLPVQIYVEGDREIAYVTRRFVPPQQALRPLGRITVRSGDRPDHLAATAYGDPTQFWRIADANAVEKPAQMTEAIGRKLILPAVTPPETGD
jgi:hypothetical protein